jgi:hypothetical protein
MAELTDIREAVRERYAAAAHAIGGERDAGCECGCGPAIPLDETATGRAAEARRWAAACRPPWPSCAPVRPCWTSAPAPAPMC